MSTSLRALMVEDSADDAMLVLAELRRGGFDVAWERVETVEAMRAALDRQPWDIVFSDYKMPCFSGLAALELLQASGRDLPFIVVSGKIGEDLAVAAMKAGANDYLMKGDLARLVPAVQRELRDADGRRERHSSEEALKMEQALMTNLLRTSPDNIYFKNRQSRFVRVSDMMARSFSGCAVPAKRSASRTSTSSPRSTPGQTYDDEQRMMSTGQPIVGLEEKETWPTVGLPGCRPPRFPCTTRTAISPGSSASRATSPTASRPRNGSASRRHCSTRRAMPST